MGDVAEGAAETLVDPGEEICRLCFSALIPVFRSEGYPNQIDPDTGLLRLEELAWVDVKTRGFSVQRRQLYSHAEAVAEAQSRDSKKSQQKGCDVRYQLSGVLIALVENISAIVADDGEPVFRVLATPLKDLPGHAEIRVLGHITTKQFLKYRPNLRDALGSMRVPEAIDA